MTRCSMAAFGICALAVGMLLAGCGGDDGGGGGGGGGGPVPLATGGFVKDAHTGSLPNWSEIISSTVTTIRVQQLYSGPSGTQPIDGAGYITAIAYKASGAVSTAITCPNVTIKMGHTSLETLTPTFASNVEQGKGSFATVMLNKTVTAPVGAAGAYIKITLDTPFYYNGVDNLVVEFVRGTACTGSVDVNYDDTTTDQAMYNNTSLVAATGSPDFAPNMRFYFAGGVNTLEYGGANSSGVAPFGWLHARFQTMYPADEINGSGPITGLGFKTSATTTTGAYTYTLMLGHTERSVLSTTFAENYRGSPVTVVSNGTFTIPGGVPANTYIWVPFPGSFAYNGTDNLLVDLEVTDGDETNSLVYTSGVGTARFIMGWAGSDTATLGYNGNVLDQAFRFNGGPITAGLGAGSSSDQVFDGDGNGAQIQCLYHAAELGTGGAISSIGVRLLSDSVAATHSDYTVRIGHTAKTQLSGADAYTVNMDENRVAHSGSFSIPAGLKAGDWVTIPLGTAFTYDPSKNLAVLFSTSGGAGASNTVRWKFSGTQYPGRVVGSEDGANTSPTWTDDGILEIRFDLQ